MSKGEEVLAAVNFDINAKVKRELIARGINIPVADQESGNELDQAILNDLVTYSEAKSILETVSGVPAMDPNLISFSMDFLTHISSLLPKKYVEKNNIFPIKHDGKFLHVVMLQPWDLDLVREIEVMTGSTLVRYVCHRISLTKAIKDVYITQESIDLSDFDGVLELAQRAANQFYHSGSCEWLSLINHPKIIHLFREIFSAACEEGVSDIHFESHKNSFQIRVRQDGVLRVAWELSTPLGRAIIGRIKLLSEMAIGETSHKPQDGRISANLVAGRDLDIRVSILPGVYGEKSVLRLLDKGKNRLTLNDLHIRSEIYDQICQTIERPNGMILVTGPTGSGKTTTLYAMLEHLNSPEVNICTAEDPVEYELPGLTQVNCTEIEGVTFAEALKSFLRQDPDVIMVGEIRDLETADIASKAALTGHLMLSTLHTNDAASTVTRLLNIGVPPFILIACNLTVVAQRLVRKICESCRVSYKPSLKEIESIGVAGSDESVKFYLGHGCENCSGTGYKGRFAVMEVLTVDSRLEQLILEEKGINEIQAAAISAGMKTLYDEAIQALKSGMTSISEVLRVTVKKDSQ